MKCLNAHVKVFNNVLYEQVFNKIVCQCVFVDMFAYVCVILCMCVCLGPLTIDTMVQGRKHRIC